MSRRAGARVAFGGLAAVVLLQYAPAVLGARVFFERDIQAYWVPQVETLVRTVAAGSAPLWDAYEGFGMPLLADPSSQVAYPFTWSNLLLPPGATYTALVVVHSLIGALGVLALARHWRLAWPAAALAGGTFVASGPFVSAANLHHHFCGASWIPWGLVAADRVMERPTPRRTVQLAAAMALQALAGSAEMVVAAAVGIAVLGLGRLVPAARSGGLRAIGSPVAAIVGAAGITGLIACIQWLPTALLLVSTNRARFDPWANLSWSVSWPGLIELVLAPGFPDLPLTTEARNVLYGGREPFLESLYLGGGALALVLVGPWAGRRLRIVAALFALTLAIILGAHFGPSAAVLTSFPLKYFRYPVKAALPMAVFWSLLVGMVLHRWAGPWPRHVLRGVRWRAGLLLVTSVAIGAAAASERALWAPASWLAGSVPSTVAWTAAQLQHQLGRLALALAAVAALALVRARWSRRRRVVVVLAALAVIADLSTRARTTHELAPAVLLARRPPVVDTLRKASPARLLSVARSDLWLHEHFVRGVPGWEPEWNWALGVQDRLAAPIGSRWGFHGSYDADFTGLLAPAHARAAAIVHAAPAAPSAVQLLRIGNVSHVVSVGRSLPGLTPLASFDSVFDAPVVLHEVPDPRPAAYLVRGVRPGKGPEQDLATMIAAGFEPAREAVIEGARAAPPEDDPVASTSVRSRRPGHWVIDVDTSRPAFLVIVEAHAPGWRATQDGVPVPIHRANALFRAVPVDPGRHVIELDYRPTPVLVGAGLSLLGLLTAAAAWIRGSRPPSR